MELGELAYERINDLLIQYNFKIEKQSSNQIVYQSDHLSITLSHNSYELANYLWIGQKGFWETEINDHILEQLFKTSIRLENLSIEQFIHEVHRFLRGEGRIILTEQVESGKKLKRFDSKRSKDYTNELLDKQYLDAASKAWNARNYIDFIENLNRLDRDKLPSSLRKKYQIALRNL